MNLPLSSASFPVLRDQIADSVRLSDTRSPCRSVLRCCCDAVALIVSVVDRTRHLGSNLDDCSCPRIRCGSLPEFLPELVCRRLHLCGSHHGLPTLRQRAESCWISATTRNGNRMLSGALLSQRECIGEMTCEDRRRNCVEARCVGGC